MITLGLTIIFIYLLGISAVCILLGARNRNLPLFIAGGLLLLATFVLIGLTSNL